MDHSLETASIFLFYRNTVAAISHGNNSILQLILIGSRTDKRCQLCMDLLIGLFHCTTNTF